MKKTLNRIADLKKRILFSILHTMIKNKKKEQKKLEEMYDIIFLKKFWKKQIQINFLVQNYLNSVNKKEEVSRTRIKGGRDRDQKHDLSKWRRYYRT